MRPEDALQIIRERFPFENYISGDPARWLTIGYTVQKYLATGARVFDFGSGACDKTAMAQLLGCRCTAVDDLRDGWHLRDDNIAKIETFAAELGIEFSRELPPPGSDPYDMVMLNDVIEHLDDSPRELLIELVSRLRPGGYLFITVPNLANIRKRLDLLRGRSNLPDFDLYYWYQGSWRGAKREYVRHDLVALCRNLGVEVIELGTVSHMLCKLPRAAHPIYRAVTAVFPDWRDTWLLVARRPEDWTARHEVPEAEFARIYGRTNRPHFYGVDAREPKSAASS